MNIKRFSLNNSLGYTLVEVTLFLAISSLLIFIALAGLGPRLRNVRFSSAIQGIQGSIARQVTNISSGDNPRDLSKNCAAQVTPYKVILGGGTGESGSHSECILNGRLIVFRSDRISYYTIASLREGSSTAGCIGATGFSSVVCHGPTVLNGIDDYRLDYEYPNGVVNYSSTLPRIVGYLQDPNSTQLYTFIYRQGAANAFDASTYEAIDASKVDIFAANLGTCFNLSNRKAKLTFTPAEIQPSVQYDNVAGC